MDENPQATPTDFEREKWRVEVELRRQELSIQERAENRLAGEAERSRWWNPLFLAVVGATIAATGNIAVSWWNGKATQEAEQLKAESARILEVIKTGDVEKARENINFLSSAGLITYKTSALIERYFDRKQQGVGPVLPSPEPGESPTRQALFQPPGPGVEAAMITRFDCPGDGGVRQYRIYQYLARPPGSPAFRVILPPHWYETIGGRDVATREEAERVASEACSTGGRPR